MVLTLCLSSWAKICYTMFIISGPQGPNYTMFIIPYLPRSNYTRFSYRVHQGQITPCLSYRVHQGQITPGYHTVSTQAKSHQVLIPCPPGSKYTRLSYRVHQGQITPGFHTVSTKVKLHHVYHTASTRVKLHQITSVAIVDITVNINISWGMDVLVIYHSSPPPLLIPLTLGHTLLTLLIR